MEQQDKRPNNKWMALINIPFQMGLIIFAFSWLGTWLDEKYPNPNDLYVKGLTLFGVFVALYNVIRQVNDLNRSK
ncbi:AtpZ/AtpI family protein [Flavobacterium sp. SM15]|uniref:AtpZ/AtpI family protein n=1 Tax=Flavobacterium sp. SM15 TaxID=2908005 RepID=UPI001EDA82C1|nr:AtpZ/AtpI family protein [Flavobacterium sp. SM15]MCG2610341.1 AtpZ/AtpI family protein [Flavobacterium sp. SM15]